MKNTKFNKGSSLLTALIFAFILMVVISALAYNFRVSSLTINTLVDDEQNTNVEQGYFTNMVGENSLLSATDKTMDSFRFVTIPDPIAVGFNSENTNTELYHADPYLLSYSGKLQFLDNGVTNHIRSYVFNTLANSILSEYSQDILPINVPYVNADAMIPEKLDSNGNVLENERGYIGYIDKSSSSDGNFRIFIGGNSSNISIPDDLQINDYKISIGWDLSEGHWNIFLAAYDTNKIYTSSTALDNLINNISQAQTDLSNWQAIADLPGGDDSSNTILVKWYHDSNKDVPKPLIIRKVERTNNSATYYDLDIYRTTYNNSTKLFTAILADTFRSGTSDYDISKVHIAIPDNEFNLDASVPLIFQGDNILEFNLNGGYTLGNGNGSTKATLAAEVETQPILVRKNLTQLYIIYSSGGYWYKYLYSPGVGTPTLITPVQSTESFETVRKLIAKFGILFVLTDSKIYVDDFDDDTTSMLNSISINNSEYQFLRDGDGLIYAIPDGLACTISGNCSQSGRIYIRTAGNCTSYNSCDKLDELNNISAQLGLVYQSIKN